MFWLFLSHFSFGQYNLVPNPSFEDHDTCPTAAGQIRYAIPWTAPLVGTTPDYFNSCDTSVNHLFNVPDNYVGFQTARHGDSYADIVTAFMVANQLAHNYREYLQVELKESLIAGTEYCLQFYVSACDSCHYISNNMGVYFSTVAIFDTCPNCTNPLPFVPQFENSLTNNLNDRFGWTDISGTYTALGNERYIVIGNFHDSTTTITSYTGWSNPNSNLFDIAVYFIDDILLTPCDSLLGINENEMASSFTISPNPINNLFKVESSFEVLQFITINSFSGKNIFTSRNINEKSITIDLDDVCPGLYFLRITTQKRQYNFKIIKN